MERNYITEHIAHLEVMMCCVHSRQLGDGSGVCQLRLKPKSLIKVTRVGQEDKHLLSLICVVDPPVSLKSQQQHVVLLNPDLGVATNKTLIHQHCLSLFDICIFFWETKK